MSRLQLALLSILVLGALAARFFSITNQPFFCDVPQSIRAVESGAMTIQFPGYAPYHLVIKFLGYFLGSAFAGALFFSLLCGAGALAYCMLFAYERAGFPGALLVCTVVGFSPLTIYFSCVGASYTTELLAMSAIIYHGNRVLAEGSDRDYRYAVLWFVFGSLMRTVSFPFAIPGIAYLLWKRPLRQQAVFTVLALTLTGLFYIFVTLHFIGGWKGLIHSTRSINTALHVFSLGWFARNVARFFIFIGWSLNILVLVLPVFLWLKRKQLNRSLSIFFGLLSFPYICILLRYVPHGGYICMIFPLLACSPLLIEKRFSQTARVASLSAAYGIISLAQFFVARPIPFSGLSSLVLNTYVLSYTRQGIQMKMFDNLTSFASKNHLDQPPAFK